jgi:hypothetical protein
LLIRDILSEGETSADISADLMDLITAYIRNKKTSIPMNGPNGAVLYLHRLGYSIDANTLMQLTANQQFNSVIERSDLDNITLATSPTDAVSKSKIDKSKDKIDKTATDVAKNVVKSGDNT